MKIRLKVLFIALAITVPGATCSSLATAAVFGDGSNQFTLDFVSIGNPNNAADTTGNPIPAGSVAYTYDIGRYEISRDMVAKANTQGNLGIGLESMSTVTGGPRPNMPATGVSWNEAARFVNWLNESEGHPAAYQFGNQPGDVDYDVTSNIDLWESGDPGFDAANPFRNTQARYFLPSIDEWYKAAYYDPEANAGEGGYWDFATGTDAEPTAIASGLDPSSSVYGQPFSQGPADIFEAGGLSPLGVMGLGGNVWEWHETEFDLTNDGVADFRTVRGGDWILNVGLLSSSSLFNAVPTNELGFFGFRVVRIPEPSTLLLGGLAVVMIQIGRRRRSIGDRA